MKGPFVPSSGIPYTVSAVANTGVPGGQSSVGAIRVAVSAAGSLMASYRDSPNVNVELHYPAAGVYIEVGHIVQLWQPGVGAPTLVPANVVTLLGS